jgi:hypothetical protein
MLTLVRKFVRGRIERQWAGGQDANPAQASS